MASWCRDCQDCQQSKVTKQPGAPTQPIPVPPRRFAHIHVHLVGPLSSSDGFSHLLIVIDRTSMWLEAIPLHSTTVIAVADVLVTGWICRFLIPLDLT